MTGLDRETRRTAATVLLLARAVYAFNWYDVGAVLPLIGSHLNASTFQLGIVLGAFLVGAAIFQVPAGLAALRWGNRTVTLFSLGLMGAFSLASAFAPGWVLLAILRFGAGVGAAFFFAPSLGLVASYYPAGSRGPMIGLYNAGFGLGSGIGLFAGALIGSAFGWSAALAVGGVGLLLAAAGAPFGLPKTERKPLRRPLGPLWDAAAPVLRSRSIWALSIGTSGLWAALYLAAQYFVDYAHAVHPQWSIALAAGIATLLILLEIPGGPIGGWLGERSPEMRRTLVAWGLVCGVGVLILPYLPLAGLFPLFAVLGFTDGVLFAVIYLIPSYLAESRGEGLALSLALINSIQIFLGSAFAIAFGYLADALGYNAAWSFAAAVALVPMGLLGGVTGRRGGAARRAGPPASPPRIARFPDRPA